jgi:hypothetical protein
VFAALGDRASALDDYRQALALEPTGTRAANARSLITQLGGDAPPPDVPPAAPVEPVALKPAVKGKTEKAKKPKTADSATIGKKSGGKRTPQPSTVDAAQDPQDQAQP